jgi:hypothetical protein
VCEKLLSFNVDNSIPFGPEWTRERVEKRFAPRQYNKDGSLNTPQGERVKAQSGKKHREKGLSERLERGTKRDWIE